MPDLPPAHRLIREPEKGARVPLGRVVLGYDERFLRRKPPGYSKRGVRPSPVSTSR